MSAVSFSHRLDRLLVETVERLGDEFPELPIAVISRCVQAVRAIVQPCAPSDVPALAARVEQTARDDLRRIAVALNGPQALAVAR